MIKMSEGKKRKTKFKRDVEPLDLLQLTENMRIILRVSKRFFDHHQLEFVITSIKSDREGVKTVSTTHEEGRAVDIRSSHLTEDQIKNFLRFCDNQFSHLGAISSKDLKVRACVYHNNHFHLQARRQETLIDKMKFWR